MPWMTVHGKHVFTGNPADKTTAQRAVEHVSRALSTEQHSVTDESTPKEEAYSFNAGVHKEGPLGVMKEIEGAGWSREGGVVRNTRSKESRQVWSHPEHPDVQLIHQWKGGNTFGGGLLTVKAKK